ncbi:MAG: hypothetical protein ABIT37_05220 [Luteolibacter sp.]
MNSNTPLRFLVGLTRIIAIYFSLRCLDQLGGAMISYQLQCSILPELVEKMPSPLAIYLPSSLFYLLMVGLVWFNAPFVCRLALKDAAPETPENDSAIAWSHVMIFLTGVLLAGWGISRIVEELTLTPLIQARTLNQQYLSNLPLAVRLAFPTVITGFGAIFMSKFHRIYRWIRQRGLKISTPA